ncbi:MAG: copper homeostasis protein CutC [Coprobacillus sp.]
MERTVEICCGSYEDALQAQAGGATRIELNSGLHLGGLTPSLGTLQLVKKNTDLKIIAMVRPRGAGFCYSDDEFEVMKLDARLLMENGADGLAFGCLKADGTIDIEQNKQIISIIKEFNGEAVFHRAFDCAKDYHQAMSILIDMGVDRLLTSGLKPKAMDGIDVIKELQAHYGDKIEILAGSGINASNAKEMMNKTGITQVHSSCKDWLTDSTTIGQFVSFEYAADPHQSDYDVVSLEMVKKIVKSI